jgi:hypothetical protein
MAAKSTAPKTIQIPEFNRGLLRIVIQGLSPLITHKFSEKAIRDIEKAQKKEAKVAKPPRNPEEEFLGGLYVIDEATERYGFPSAGIKKALVNAGGRFADEQMTVLRGLINILPGDLVEIHGSKPEMRRDPVRLTGGTTSLAYRPMFREWQIGMDVRYNKGLTTPDQIANLFNIAGFAVGIGDWRPEKNGNFGQFEIIQLAEYAEETPVVQAITTAELPAGLR